MYSVILGEMPLVAGAVAPLVVLLTMEQADKLMKGLMLFRIRDGMVRFRTGYCGVEGVGIGEVLAKMRWLDVLTIPSACLHDSPARRSPGPPAEAAFIWEEIIATRQQELDPMRRRAS